MKLIQPSSLSAAVSEVSGGTTTLPTRWFLILARCRFCDPPSDHQREARCPVSHRHSETQETAVRTSPAMTITSDHSHPPSLANAWMPLTLSPRQHLISTSHGNQWCTYMLTNTTADEGMESNRHVCLILKKRRKKRKLLFHEEECKSCSVFAAVTWCHWLNFDLWTLLCHLLALCGFSGSRWIIWSSALQKGYRITQKKMTKFLLTDSLVYSFFSCSVLL